MFLKALQARATFGNELWHVFPQAIKLDHVLARADGHRYDALVRIEAFLSDVNALRKLIGAAPFSEDELDRVSAPFRHSHADTSCAHVDWSYAPLRHLARELYNVDFVCLNYTWPV